MDAHATPEQPASRASLSRHVALSLCAVVLEIVVALLLFASHDGRSAAAHIFDRFAWTRSSMADLVVLAALKAVLVLGGGWLASYLGRIVAVPPKASDELPRADDVIVQPLLMPGGACSSCSSSAGAATSTSPAARNGAHHQNGTRGAVAGDATVAPTPPSAAAPTQPAADESLGFDAKNRANTRRQTMVGAVFLVSTAFQMFVGIKTIRFDFIEARVREEAILLGVLVLLTNVSTWLVVRAVREATKEDGFLVPEFHAHALYHRTNLALHHCDLCSERGTTFYSCRQCGFDVCPRCFAKKDKRT